MTARFFFLGGALMVFASVAFGKGTYQRTKDGKTIVWNNDPQPGEAAGWWGDRDHDGYATGFGTLTWYKERQQTGASSNVPTPKYTVYARYFGNMVRGKFNGAVNVHSNGKTAHAIFIEGRLSGRWLAGAAPSRRVAVRAPSRAEEERTDIAKARSIEPVRQAQGKLTPNIKPRTEDIPAEGPRGAVRIGERNAKPATGSASSGQANSNNVREDSAQLQKTSRADSLKAEPSAERPSVIIKRPPNKPVPPPPSNSLERLSGPPSSLGTNPVVEASPAGQPASARLTKEEVIDLADAQVRSRGYNPAEYQRPEPQYDPADDTWSLLYEQKTGDGIVDIGKHLGVAVDDKTKKTSIVPGR